MKALAESARALWDDASTTLAAVADPRAGVAGRRSAT